MKLSLITTLSGKNWSTLTFQDVQKLRGLLPMTIKNNREYAKCINIYGILCKQIKRKYAPVNTCPNIRLPLHAFASESAQLVVLRSTPTQFVMQPDPERLGVIRHHYSVLRDVLPPSEELNIVNCTYDFQSTILSHYPLLHGPLSKYKFLP